MNFEKTFCPSPWFHMRITNSGHYKFCRWTDKTVTDNNQSIRDVSPAVYFQKGMSEIRNNMQSGICQPACSDCYQMEKYNKVSGRQKQLLKVGIDPDNFVKTALSSPWIGQFAHTSVDLLPQDWQIDLGNFCNSGCVFCGPEDSSKLAAEFKKLKLINKLPLPNWTDDPESLLKFIDTIKQSTTVKYLHFIGGETLITPAFKKILKELVANNINLNASIGFTTNLHCWDQEVVDLLTNFKEVNLGVSVECFDKLNDYVRWPSKIENVNATLDRWLSIAKNNNWTIQFRTTPTWLTVGKLLTIYDRAIEIGTSVESCNFLEKPEHLRISVLPKQYRQPIVDQMKQWLKNHQSTNVSKIYNTRNPNTLTAQVVQDLASYVDYLENSEYQTEMLPAAIQYLKLLESNRKNSILDYLPEYEQLFRSSGY
jgi:sulfatase maturation enzyme AslB (radical SAM superfamily)